MKAKVLADYILLKYSPMSHLKLQKLLYYCQAYHLAYFDEPLLEEDFQAWVHGPVCRVIYDEHKSKAVLYKDLLFEGDASEVMGNFKNESLSNDQIFLLTDVLNSLNTWTAFELESATHKERPWLEARVGYSAGEICNEIISKESMRAYYKKELIG